MKRFFKWFFGILITLIVIIVGLAIALPYIIDPNDYKEDIVAYIKEYTGHEARIDGDIKLSFFSDFPDLNAEINGVVILNAEGFVVKPFMTMKNASVNLDLISLMSDEIEVGTLTFNEPVLNLQRDEEGRNNWDFIINHTQNMQKQQATEPADPEDKVNVKLQKIEITEARIIWDDQLNASTLQVHKINLETGAVDLTQPVNVHGKFNVYLPENKTGTASAINITLHMQPEKDLFEITNLKLNTNIANKEFLKKTIKTSFNIPAIRFEKDKVTISKLTFKMNQSTMTGYFNITNLDKRPRYAFNIKVDQFMVDDYLPKSKNDDVIDEPTGKPGDESIISFKLPKNLVVQGTIKIDKLHVDKLVATNVDTAVFASQGNLSFLTKSEIYDGKHEGEIHVQTLTSPVRVRCDQRIEGANFSKIARAYKSDSTAAGKLTFSVNLFTEGNNARNWLSNLNGEGRFKINRAKISQAELDKLLLGKWHDKLKRDESIDPNKNLTVFDRVRGGFSVKNGVIYNKDFQAISKRVHVNGFGFTSLITQKLDYTMHIVFKKDYEFSIDGREHNLKDKAIPIEINGYWVNLDITLAVEDAAMGRINTTIKQERQDIERKINREEYRARQRLEEEKKKYEDDLPDFLK